MRERSQVNRMKSASACTWHHEHLKKNGPQWEKMDNQESFDSMIEESSAPEYMNDKKSILSDGMIPMCDRKARGIALESLLHPKASEDAEVLLFNDTTIKKDSSPISFFSR